MATETIFQAALLGLVEGLTEFIPVSSTAHLLLLGHFLGFKSPGRAFEVLIQLGAICAVVGVYFARLWRIAMALPSDPKARKFVFGVVLAFLPAAVVGVLLHDFIKSVLFEAPSVICVTLIVGGLLLMWLDSMDLRPRYTEATDYPLSLYFKIGVFQCLAMIPGVSRSGATIGGALLMGADKRSAAEFSFFLAMPTMAGAFAYDLYKNFDILGGEDAKLIAVGFAMSLVSGVIVVRALLDFVSRHGFTPFAWWRIVVGSAGLAGIWVYG